MSPEAREILSGLLIKDPAKRLGGGPEDAEEIKSHDFFKDIAWADLEAKKVDEEIERLSPVRNETAYFCFLFQLEPPFRPQVMSETDTRYFDTEFTGESVELTPPDESALSESAIQEVDESTFEEFSYRSPGSVMTTGSMHSRNSLPIHSE